MCIYPYVHMCEMNINNIFSCVHVYMQKGAYITLFAYVDVCAYMCGNAYVYTSHIWMILECGCIYIIIQCIIIYHYICV